MQKFRRKILWLVLSTASECACSFALASETLRHDADSDVATIHSFYDVTEGHGVGRITIDQIGNIYVADFGETVTKITPEGRASEFAVGLYGASGDAIDGTGNLLQANFFRDSITKIDRLGRSSDLITTNLSGPVGITINRDKEIFIANCRSNVIDRIGNDGSHRTFAKSDLFSCPNGLSFDSADNLFVVNFRDNRMLKVTANGVVSLFAEVSEKGLGHLCYKNSRFYITAYASHELYEVTQNGAVMCLLGNGERGLVDCGADKARLTFPNGIACHPWAPKLYINEYVNDTAESLPRRSAIREVTIDEK